MASRPGRLTSLRAPAISVSAAAGFFALARWTGEAPALAVWGGAVWVFFLSTIVALPLLAGWDARRAAGSRGGRDRSPMMLALAVWLCTLPLVLLLVAPWFGIRAALGAAVGLLAGITVVCWTLCASGRTPSSFTEEIGRSGRASRGWRPFFSGFRARYAGPPPRRLDVDKRR